MVKFHSDLSDFPKVLEKFKKSAGIYIFIIPILKFSLRFSTSILT